LADTNYLAALVHTEVTRGVEHHLIGVRFHGYLTCCIRLLASSA
jgi:hypothetical protein